MRHGKRQNRFFVGQPPSRGRNCRPRGGNDVSQRAPSPQLCTFNHLNPKKNIKMFTFSDLRGYPEDRRPPPRLPQGPYCTGTRKVLGILGKVHKQHVALRLPTDHSFGRFQDRICTTRPYAYSQQRKSTNGSSNDVGHGRVLRAVLRCRRTRKQYDEIRSAVVEERSRDKHIHGRICPCHIHLPHSPLTSPQRHPHISCSHYTRHYRH